MQRKEIYAKVDHTLLLPDATWDEIRTLCDDAMAFGTASVCIAPCFVRRAVDYMKGALPVCTVVGFPCGNATTASKVFETREALQNGASEVDMVIHIGALKAGDTAYVLDEIRQMKAVVGEKILKVIIETCLLSREEKITMCRLVTQGGADYIKTSTGFSTAGATFQDVELFRQHVGPHVKIKAAGGVASFEDAIRFIELGASRLGTSRVIKLAKAEQAGVNPQESGGY